MSPMDGQFPNSANGWVSIVAPDSLVPWQWQQFELVCKALHHDIEVMPNGNILAIACVIVSLEEAYALGWNHQRQRKIIVLDKFIEVRPNLGTGEANIVWEWSTRNHLVQNSHENLPNYGNPADYPDGIDINLPQLEQVQFNSGHLFHVNSISYNAGEDIILLS